MIDQPLVIASAANERYASGLGVMMCSALLCTGTRNVRFCIIDDGISSETKTRLEERVLATAMAKGIQVELNFMDFSRIVLPPLAPLHGAITAYARIFFAEMLDIRSIYYVDADIICNREFPAIEGLIAQYPGALLIGCQDAMDVLEKDCPWVDDLREDERQLPYINTGFMCMNLEALRDFGIQKQFVDLAARGKPMPFADQTALNFLCRGRVGLMSPDFNHLWNKSAGLQADAECNIHFVGPVKPWHAEVTAGSLLQISLFNTTARQLGFPIVGISKWDERRITAGFHIAMVAKLIFYQLTFNHRRHGARRRLKKWRLMRSYNRAHEARLRAVMGRGS